MIGTVWVEPTYERGNRVNPFLCFGCESVPAKRFMPYIHEALDQMNLEETTCSERSGWKNGWAMLKKHWMVWNRGMGIVDKRNLNK